MSEIILKGIPTFRILDYNKAIDFYVQGLGFNIDWEHRFGPGNPVYMQISRSGLTLHLSENKRFETGVIVFVNCKGLNQLYSELNNRESKIELSKPEKSNWQTIQMEIEDPFGNVLRFNETIAE
ncbi:MAG: glyoxalase superfamily protein [Flavobacteriaceae bacterium]|nr:glyoxalase superfamily protein [Flavobacteriaceae bacterium]